MVLRGRGTNCSPVAVTKSTPNATANLKTHTNVAELLVRPPIQTRCHHKKTALQCPMSRSHSTTRCHYRSPPQIPIQAEPVHRHPSGPAGSGCLPSPTVQDRRPGRGNPGRASSAPLAERRRPEPRPVPERLDDPPHLRVPDRDLHSRGAVAEHDQSAGRRTPSPRTTPW